MKKFTFYILFLLLSHFSLAQETKNAENLIQIADSLTENSDYDSAIQTLKKACNLLKNSISQPNILQLYIHCQNKISQNLLGKGKFDEALTLTNQTLSLNQSKTNAKNLQQSEILNTLGFLYLNKGRNDLALDFFTHATELCEELKKTESSEMALCYNNLGLVYGNTGNIGLAREYHQKALSIRNKFFGQNHVEVAASYNNLGLTYGLEDEALENYEKSYQILLKIYGEKHAKVAFSLNNIALVQLKQKHYDDALENFQKVLDIWNAIHAEPHPHQAFVYTNIGRTYFEQMDYDTALEYQEMALKIYRKHYGGKHPEIANTYNQIGSIYKNLGKFDLALDNFQQAILANSPVFNKSNIQLNPKVQDYYQADLQLISFLLKAQTLEARHFGKTLKFSDLAMALQTLQSCDSLIDHIRQLRTLQNDKIALGNLATEIYTNAIKISLQLAEYSVSRKNYWQKAFYFAEKSKAAVLLEAIADTQAKQFAGIPDSLLENERKLNAEIAFYEQKLAEKPELIIENQYKDQLFALNRQYEDFRSKLEKSFPEYFDLKFNVKIADIPTIQQKLDSKTTLISFFISDQRIYNFQVSKEKFEVLDLPKPADFEKEIIAFRNSIYYRSQKTFEKQAYILYKTLFDKILPSKTDQLVIIPDGRLGTIPFEALLTQKVKSLKTNLYKDLPFLIKKYAVSYSFSATLFLQNPQKSTEKLASNVFLFAPIEFKADLKNNFRPELETLLGTQNEVEKIANLFTNKGLSFDTFLRNQAQESLLKSKQLKKYRFLHFATHGEVNESQPELSQIFLALDSLGKEDGSLYAGEIYNLGLSADLVTLSACQTGLGKITKGEGMIGLSRALLFAGARNLLVSLWKVSDESTSLLMIDFYKYILDNQLLNQSLRSAKLQMLTDEKFAKPYFWSAFVLIGK